MGWRGIEGFNADCALFMAQTREQAGQYLRFLALEALQGVVNMTPVDRSQLRASWFVTFDEPVGMTDPEKDFQPVTAEEVIQAGAARIRLAKVGDVVFIGNAMPYAEVVEYGGFVPKNPSNEIEPMKRRAWSRRPVRRKQAELLYGNEGATFVAGGFSKQAPAGMVGVTFARLRDQIVERVA